MAYRASLAMVRSYIERQTLADALSGLAVRKRILDLVTDHRHPEAAKLLRQIEQLDRALLDDGRAPDGLREGALLALDQFESALAAGKVVHFGRRLRRE